MQIETIHLYHLFHNVTWYLVVPHLLSEHFNAHNLLHMYKLAYDEILTIPFTPNPHLSLIFESEENFIFTPYYIDSDNLTHSISHNWNFWLSLRVHPIILNMYSREFVVAACLYSMTMLGYSQSEISECVRTLSKIDQS